MASGSDDNVNGRMKPALETFNKNCSLSDEGGSINSGNDDVADIHQPLPYSTEDNRTGTIRFPRSRQDSEDGTDEEPVKSKPRKGSRRSQPSSTDTTDSSEVGGAKLPKPKKKSSSKAKADSPPSDYGGDDDSEPTGISEATNAVVHNATSQVDQPWIKLTKTMPIKLRHKKFCKGVTRWQISPKEFPIQIGRAICFSKHGVKICHLKLHCRGLAEDYDHRFATLEAVVCFLPKSTRLLELYDCSITLAVDVYRDQVHPTKRIGTETATTTRTLNSDERTQNTIDIVVNQVVNLDEIVYHDVCPEAIILQIKATLEARLIQVSATDSGADAFVEISMSFENLTS